MILSLFQIALVLLVALYLGRLRMAMRYRNRQSWESLIARLRGDFNARELSAHFLWREGLSASPDEAWTRMHGTRGLVAMYKNAAVMMQIAEFAARNSDCDPEALETLRSDAAQIRLCVLKSLAQFVIDQAVDHAHESVKITAFQAASMYTGMAARTVQLLHVHAAAALPEFVAAM
jgi:hypothetical protein